MEPVLNVEIRHNFIATLGEGVEIEGLFGQDTYYFVENNHFITGIQISPFGVFMDRHHGSVAEGFPGSHPGVLRVIANEGIHQVLNNDSEMFGKFFG